MKKFKKIDGEFEFIDDYLTTEETRKYLKLVKILSTSSDPDSIEEIFEELLESILNRLEGEKIVKEDNSFTKKDLASHRFFGID